MSDRRLRLAVQEELQWDPQVDATRLGVVAIDGAITLTGRASSHKERLAALKAAFAAAGVQSVADRIVVDRAGVGPAPSPVLAH